MNNRIAWVAALAFAAFGSVAEAQTITTVAGAPPYSSVANATSVPLGDPWPVNVAPDGTVYFGYSATIYSVSPSSSTLRRVAGDGVVGNSGDGGLATAARFFRLSGLATDSASNLYVSDFNAHVIRKIAKNGTISTIAGTGTRGSSADNVPARTAALNGPVFVSATSAGVVYVCDFYNGVVRKIQGGIISTVRGTEGSYPLAAAMDRKGNLYYIDDSWEMTGRYPKNILMKLTPGNAVPVPVAELNTFGFAEGMSFDLLGNIYTTDYRNQVILQISPTGTVAVVAGKPGVTQESADGVVSTSATLNGPWDVSVASNGTIYFTEGSTHSVRSFRLGGVLQTRAGNRGVGDGGTAMQPVFSYRRQGSVVDSAGNIYIAADARIRKVTARTGIISTIAGSDIPAPSIAGGDYTVANIGFPSRMVISSAGDLLFTTYNSIYRLELSSGSISRVAGSDGYGDSGDGGPALQATLSRPSALAFDGSGNLYFSPLCTLPMDSQWTYSTHFLPAGTPKIRKINAYDGSISTIVGSGATGYSGDGALATGASMNCPSGIAVDPHGNIFIADTNNHVVRKVDGNTGLITTFAGTGQSSGYSGDGGLATLSKLSYPQDVTVDSRGNVYIADFGNNVIRKVSAAGFISTVAGTGVGGFGGDGGPARKALLNGPKSLTLDAAGNLYVDEAYNFRIRKISGL